MGCFFWGGKYSWVVCLSAKPGVWTAISGLAMAILGLPQHGSTLWVPRLLFKGTGYKKNWLRHASILCAEFSDILSLGPLKGIRYTNLEEI